MPTSDEVQHQFKLLALHRRNLATRLRQYGRHGESDVPLVIENDIISEREDINRIKWILRGWGQAVEDHPDDIEHVRQKQSDRTGRRLKVTFWDETYVGPCTHDADGLTRISIVGGDLTLSISGPSRRFREVE